MCILNSFTLYVLASRYIFSRNFSRKVAAISEYNEAFARVKLDTIYHVLSVHDANFFFEVFFSTNNKTYPSSARAQYLRARKEIMMYALPPALLSESGKMGCAPRCMYRDHCLPLKVCCNQECAACRTRVGFYCLLVLFYSSYFYSYFKISIFVLHICKLFAISRTKTFLPKL